MISIAILCGGLGTRAQQPINKCFVDVSGKPFVLRIMEQLEDQGFSTFVLCRGSSGTLRAIKNAREQLGDRFIVLYGDTFLKIDLNDFIVEWDRSQLPAICAERDGIDAGVNGFETWMLGLGADSLVELQSMLKSAKFIHHYSAKEHWHEVGTPSALEEARKWFSTQARSV